jgi:hypothetical protein
MTVSKLNLEGIELAVRPWCDPKDYWTVYFGTPWSKASLLCKLQASKDRSQVTMNITQTFAPENTKYEATT